jgi:hypothetical protein
VASSRASQSAASWSGSSVTRLAPFGGSLVIRHLRLRRPPGVCL